MQYENNFFSQSFNSTRGSGFKVTPRVDLLYTVAKDTYINKREALREGELFF